MSFTNVNLAVGLGLGCLFWFSFAVIVTRQTSLQRALSRVTPWLLAASGLLIYGWRLSLYGFSVYPLVLFCLYFGVPVWLGWKQFFVLQPLRGWRLWLFLLIGVLNTIATYGAFFVWYPSKVPVGLIVIGYDPNVLNWFTGLILLGVSGRGRRQAR